MIEVVCGDKLVATYEGTPPVRGDIVSARKFREEQELPKRYRVVGVVHVIHERRWREEATHEFSGAIVTVEPIS